MQSWSSSNVPSLPGQGHPLRLYDTAAREIRTTEPGPVARMYVCGITPYDATHLGHANTYLAFDLVNRAWRDAGHEVHYTQNATDVDDPLLERAQRDGQDWRRAGRRPDRALPHRHGRAAHPPPAEYVGVTEVVDQVAALIERLGEATYTVDGDVYFARTAAPKFGAVSGYDEETMLALFGERGGDPDRPGKRDLARLAALAGRAPRRAPPGPRPSGPAGPAGTSSAPPSR